MTVDDPPPLSPRWRPWLLWGLPMLAAIAAGAYWYVNRGFVTTDNAYLKSHKTLVAARVSGTINQVFVEENARVAAGDRLFTLDDASFRVSVEEARARLQQVRSDVAAMKAEYAQKTAELDIARRSAAFAQRESSRQGELAAQKLVAQQKRDDAEEASQLAGGRVVVVERDIAALRERLGGSAAIAVDQHPNVRAAASAVARAEMDLGHATVFAPVAGIASRIPELGAHLTVGAPALAIVADEQLWIEANLKETDLAQVRAGQSVDVRVDTYADHVWRGRVDSIAQATGAEFALLPAQNASGNWVKVVQRVPVRIVLDRSADDPPLRAGMSASVRIDTRANAGQGAPRAARAEP